MSSIEASVHRAPRSGRAHSLLDSLFAAFLCASLAFVAACGDDKKDDDEQGKDDAGAPGVELGLSSDWLNHTLTLVDLQKIEEGATREDIMIDEIDLSMYKAGPLNAEIVPGTKIAIVALSAGYFSLFNAGMLFLGAMDVPTDPGMVIFVDLEKREVIAEIDTGKHPMGITITPDGKRAFIVHFASPHVAVIDVEKRELLETVEVGPYSEEIILDDSGEVGIFAYSAAGNFRTFGSEDFAGTLSPDVPLEGDAAGVAFFPGTKIAYLVHAYMPLTGAAGGYAIIDVSDPSAPVVLEDVDIPNAGISYPATSVPKRGSVVVPYVRNNMLVVEETVLEDGKSKIKQSIEAGPSKLFGAYTASVRADGKVLLAVPSSRAVVLVDLDEGTAERVDWAIEPVGPTDIIPVP